MKRIVAVSISGGAEKPILLELKMPSDPCDRIWLDESEARAVAMSLSLFLAHKNLRSIVADPNVVTEEEPR